MIQRDMATKTHTQKKPRHKLSVVTKKVHLCQKV